MTLNQSIGLDDERGLLTRAVLGEPGPAAVALRAALRPAGVLYGLAVRARNALFDHGWKQARRLPVPVVSIGNISVGGTGKTPLVEWAVRRLREAGRRPAILSRGYGAAVQDYGVDEEAAMLAENLADIPHLRDADRFAAGQRAIDEFGADVLVLDDGFQHRRLARDLDIVLIDALAAPYRDRLLPAGSLREPATSLARADAFVVTRSDLCAPGERERLHGFLNRAAPDTPVADAVHEPATLVFAESTAPPEELRGRRVYAFCGIGNPRGFVMALQSLGAEIAAGRIFPDHHAYRDADIARLCADARDAEMIVTTQKDVVKLRGRWPDDRLAALTITMKLAGGAEALEELLAGVCKR